MDALTALTSMDPTGGMTAPPVMPDQQTGIAVEDPGIPAGADAVNPDPELEALEARTDLSFSQKDGYRRYIAGLQTKLKTTASELEQTKAREQAQAAQLGQQQTIIQNAARAFERQLASSAENRITAEVNKLVAARREEGYPEDMLTEYARAKTGELRYNAAQYIQQQSQARSSLEMQKSEAINDQIAANVQIYKQHHNVDLTGMIDPNVIAKSLRRPVHDAHAAMEMITAVQIAASQALRSALNDPRRRVDQMRGAQQQLAQQGGHMFPTGGSTSLSPQQAYVEWREGRMTTDRWMADGHSDRWRASRGPGG
jgi:hypothetical protein